MFLYYFPGKNALNEKDYESLQLGQLDKCVKTTRQCKGPDDERGVILLISPRDYTGKLPTEGYFPDKQKWQKTNRGYWIGLDIETPPIPDGLIRERKDLIAGHEIDLHGHLWMCPLARMVDGTNNMPQKLGIGMDGKFVSAPMEEYKSFSRKVEQAHKTFEALMGFTDDETMKPPSFESLFYLAVEGLQINYRLGIWEATILELFNQKNIADVVRAFFDGPSIEAVMEEIIKEQDKSDKKKDSAQDTQDISDTRDGKEVN